MSNGQSDFLLWELQCWFLQVHTRRNTERAFPMSFDSYMLRRIQVWLIDSIFSPLSPLQHELELKHTQKDALNGCRINNGRTESFLNTNFQLFLVQKYDSIPCPFEIFNIRNMLRLLGNVVRILMFSFLKIPKQQNEKKQRVLSLSACCLCTVLVAGGFMLIIFTIHRGDESSFFTANNNTIIVYLKEKIYSTR